MFLNSLKSFVVLTSLVLSVFLNIRRTSQIDGRSSMWRILRAGAEKEVGLWGLPLELLRCVFVCLVRLGLDGV